MAIDYAKQQHHDFVPASRQALRNRQLQAALERLTDTLMAANRRGYAALPDADALRSHAKRIKEHTLAHLSDYLEQLEGSVTSLGGRVHWASDADDACRIVLSIAEAEGVKRVVKAKSMTSEEIHLNEALEWLGVEVTETDFGEFVIQLEKERPSHLVAPAVHHTKLSIAKVLSHRLHRVIEDEARTLAMTGRAVLRERFRQAEMGITGVNFAVAETGTIVLVTNEGNGRLTTTWPRVHVAIMGIEKVIPRWRDLPVFLKLLARAATGQPLSVYTTLISGPRKPGETDGPERFHLVILDNGRSRILASPFRESLQCLRCGACLNACPVYRRVGGHAYGGVYSGPIGSILTPLFDSVTDYHHLPHASSLCGACLSACPVKIDIPHMLIGLRELEHRCEPKSAERLGYWLWTQIMRRPRLYRWALRLGRAVAARFSANGWFRRLPGFVGRWTQSRDFPAPAPQSFREWWEQERSSENNQSVRGRS